ncbi:DUF4868 domain-containing protein [Natrarchaeobius halalkaliphilus]|uniref:DUF4868 domain-containing protein n=1 Tax=Natrarchaeobius halalkaliphilus TaxID=1679091 RepID=A0A3N6LW85_9EURY|nr:Kiwa anti-phage protein KwaB-like domain-containing protein [Natrarchaeobius halalkaliphilus]RQG93087.1 DUF4868 domain-containing protein [Natrarchaeobius halalkaliphilus]
MTTQNDAADTLKNAREFVQGNTSTDYLLVHKRETGPEIQTLEFRKTVQNELEKLFADVLTSYIDKVRDGSVGIRNLSAINTVTDESLIQHATIDELPDTELFRSLTSDSTYPTTKYDKNDPPDFQLIKVSDGKKHLIGIQNHRSLKTYDASKSGIPLLYRDAVYSKFESDLLIVPEALNAIYFEDQLFVMTPKSFEKMFEMRDEYEQKAETVISNFEDSGIRFSKSKITDDWMINGDIRVLRKLYTVHENEIPTYATPDRIKMVIDKYDIEVQYRKKNGFIELDIEEYTDIWKLLRLLNSDYAEAELIPDARLEIESKRIMD